MPNDDCNGPSVPACDLCGAESILVACTECAVMVCVLCRPTDGPLCVVCHERHHRDRDRVAEAVGV